MKQQKQLFADVTTLAFAFYVVGLLLVVPQPLDAAFTIGFGADPSSLEWRYGAVSIVTGSLLLPMLGAFLILCAATLAGHRWMQYAISVVLAVGAVAVLSIAVLHALDGVQLRAQLVPELRRRFLFVLGKTVFVQLLMVSAMAAMAVAGVRTARRSARAEPSVRHGGAESTPLVAAATR
jgi:hypothetical protein